MRSRLGSAAGDAGTAWKARRLGSLGGGETPRSQPGTKSLAPTPSPHPIPPPHTHTHLPTTPPHPTTHTRLVPVCAHKVGLVQRDAQLAAHGARVSQVPLHCGRAGGGKGGGMRGGRAGPR